MIELTEKQVEDLYFEGFLADEDVAVVEEGEWIHGHKHQSCRIIFHHTPSDRYYSAYIGRSGDHFQGYMYDSEILGGETLNDSITEVVQKEVTTTEWVMK